MNPLPILSAIQNLIEVSDFPCQSPDATQSDTELASDANATPFGVQASIIISVENTQLLFLVDKKKILRGTLNLTVFGMTLEVDTGDSSGTLLLSTEPVLLCAGRTTHKKRFKPMPFQPIADIDGVRLLITGTEEQIPPKGTLNTADPETTATLKLSVEFRTESLQFNASPSTIVCLLGTASTLNPFLDWVQGESASNQEDLEAKQKREAKQYMSFQRSHLRKLFSEIDVDGSGQISEDELETLVVNLLCTHDKQKQCTFLRRTKKEISRERDYLLSIMDTNRTNEIAFQELDNAFFRLANKIDDVNLIPDIKDDAYPYNNDFSHEDSFLSGPVMRQIVYYEDLREFAGTSEMYRITSHVSSENSLAFPAPAMWPNGEGIQHFWDLYSEGTGCTRHSLNGQDMATVQRKLVRILR